MTDEPIVRMMVATTQIGEAQDLIHSIMERDVFIDGLPNEEVVAKAITVYASFIIAVHTGIEAMYATAFETESPRLSANDLLDQMLENSKSFLEEHEKRRRSKMN